MVFPDFSSPSPVKLEHYSPLLAIASIVRRKHSGLLRCQAEKIVRQLQFKQGVLVAAASNTKHETPGGFLQKQGRLTAEASKQFLAEIKKPKTTAWKVAAELASLSGEEVVSFRDQLNLQIAISASTLDKVALQYTPAAPSEGTTKGPDGLRLLLSIAAEVQEEKIPTFCPSYTAESIIRLTRVAEKELENLPLTTEERGLLKVIQANEKLDDVFSSSFLGAEKIRTGVVAYWLAGLVTLESATEVAQQRHDESLSEEERQLRDEMRKVAESLDQTNYYEWLSLAPQTTPEEIEQTATTRMERYAAPIVDKLFIQQEKDLPTELLQRLAEAKKVLLNPTKKAEYDQYITQGQTGSFLSESVSVREEEVLQQAKASLQAGNEDQALQALSKGVQELPKSVPVTVFFSRTLLEKKGVKDAPGREQALLAIKKLIQACPKAGEAYEVYGEWMKAAGQKEKAYQAFRKTLSLTPFSLSARQELMDLDRKTAPKDILEAISRKLEGANHYQLLSVTNNASGKEIQRAYHNCTKHFHPDRFFQSTDEKLKDLANTVYKRMVHAYTVLKHPSKRKEYDAGLERGVTVAQGGKPAPLSPEPQTARGKKFYELALKAIQAGDKDGAKLNLGLGLQMEPDCPALKEKLAEIS